MLTFDTTTRNTGSGHPDDDVTLYTALCENDDDLIELREQHDEFHEGALSLLHYPSHVVGFLSHDLPKAFSAKGFTTPIKIAKDDAGNFSFIDL